MTFSSPPSPSLWPRAFLVLLLAALVSPTGARADADLVIENGTVRDPQGATVSYEIGTLLVPENRQVPGSRTISIGFARIKAPRPTGAPPVFWLPGGPGLTVLGAFTDSDPASQGRLKSWLTFGAAADLVILEQRGYTRRGEILDIKSEAFPLDKPASVQADAEAMRALARAAVAAHPDKDLSGYTIAAFAADVDALRRALGYDKISLFGGSFGSQWSLAVMRLYPDTVARAVLSGVEPLDNGYDMPSHVLAALQRIAYDADRDPRLAPYLPPGGIMEAVRALHQRFAAGPVRVEVRDEAGEAQTVTLGAEDLQLALLSHTQEGAQWPAFILSLYHAHYDAWAREVIDERKPGTIKLIGPLVDSSLGVSPAREHRLRTDPAVALLGTWNFATNIASAPDWPSPDMGDDLRKPVECTIPTLFVHGDWDTSTPIDNTLGLLPYFRNGHAILVHRAGHDGTFYQLRGEPAVKQAVYEFLKTGEMKDLPVEVTLPVPEFALPPFPPPARRDPPAP
ncbi:alpha/beta hydrolase [Chondromyces apiculatus]|uniref:Cysteine proteinase n=1 Tax=Chondromyces apiculatus DSM 436 TaxID=1192034 RepID=A0A017TD91_9BACT|nr:alpha/beta hydrolase [Chondromyces apiculatus]EYF07209.1 cysteine proteinase [Chondromyces apiculatus DSM 436]